MLMIACVQLRCYLRVHRWNDGLCAFSGWSDMLRRRGYSIGNVYAMEVCVGSRVGGSTSIALTLKNVGILVLLVATWIQAMSIYVCSCKIVVVLKMVFDL
jgi:hypothetical protein